MRTFPPPEASDRSHPDDRAAAVFDRRIDNPAQARTWITTFVDERGCGKDMREDAVLVVSELVTNGLRYGSGEVVVRASLTEGGLSISVTDSGDELPNKLPLGGERIGGLGLHIVERLATRWGVSAFPGGKTVWAVLAAGSTA